VNADRAVRLARVVEAMGGDLSLRVASRGARLRRVEDAWLRDISRRSLTAAARELAKARADGSWAAERSPP
jgi:hypothetical protein